MDIGDKLLQVGVFLAEDGLVPVALDAPNHHMLKIRGVSSRAARGMNSCYPMRMQASSYTLIGHNL